MKELYISPELEILCFAPIENIANDLGASWDWGTGLNTAAGDNISQPDILNPDDYTEDVEDIEGL